MQTKNRYKWIQTIQCWLKRFSELVELCLTNKQYLFIVLTVFQVLLNNQTSNEEKTLQQSEKQHELHRIPKILLQIQAPSMLVSEQPVIHMINDSPMLPEENESQNDEVTNNSVPLVIEESEEPLPQHNLISEKDERYHEKVTSNGWSDNWRQFTSVLPGKAI